MHSEAKTHYVRIKVSELKRRSIFWQGPEIDPEEINGELSVNVMEFVEIFRFIGIIGTELLKAVKVVRTLLVYAFVDPEEFSALYGDENSSAERASEDHVAISMGGTGLESVAANLAKDLTAVAIVFVKVDHRGAALGAAGILRDITRTMTLYGLKDLAVTKAIILKEVLPVPVLRDRADEIHNRRFINMELLILGRM